MQKLNLFDKKCLELALKEARKNDKDDFFPVGAVFVVDGKIIAKAGNEFNLNKKEKRSYVNHAEILLIIQKALFIKDL